MSDLPPLRITYLTPGAAGMYCGSCMHDNTLARALSRLGVDVQLVPLYTPIQTDETDVTVDQVFFGGINVYLQQRSDLFRRLPNVLDRILDWPRLLRWIGSRGIETDASQLGDLAISMLRGSAGFQRKEVARLCRWLSSQPAPHLINLSNVLIAGCVPDLRAALGVPITVTLQGDDVFLEALPSKYRREALEQIRRLASHVDAFLVHSQYYADFMADYLGVPGAKFRRIPLGIDVDGYPPRQATDTAGDAPEKPLHIGYLARLAPEKGLHILIDAFLLLQHESGLPPIRLLIAGWLGKRHRQYAQTQFAKLESAGLGDSFEYLGTLSRAEKVALLSRLDLFSVPATYGESKGLYVLESLAAGTPVVQPNLGAFPELLAQTGGGQLIAANDPASLAHALHQLLRNSELRRELGRVGQETVHQRFNAQTMAQQTLSVWQDIIAAQPAPSR